MVSISFSDPKFKPLLISGDRDKTTRPRNAVRVEQMWRLGLQIYYKQRSPNGEKLFDGELTEATTPISFAGHKMYAHRGRWVEVRDTEDHVKREGFKTFDEYYNWLKNRYSHNLPSMQFDILTFRRKTQRDLLEFKEE